MKPAPVRVFGDDCFEGVDLGAAERNASRDGHRRFRDHPADFVVPNRPQVPVERDFEHGGVRQSELVRLTFDRPQPVESVEALDGDVDPVCVYVSEYLRNVVPRHGRVRSELANPADDRLVVIEVVAVHARSVAVYPRWMHTSGSRANRHPNG